MTNLKIWKFSAQGNFSHSFGWDNGLEAQELEATTFVDAYEGDDLNSQSDSFAIRGGVIPQPAVEGVFEYFFNEHGGSRESAGWVVAATQERATALLAEFCNRFQVVEYESCLDDVDPSLQ
jgi:hypothetical protein